MIRRARALALALAALALAGCFHVRARVPDPPVDRAAARAALGAAPAAPEGSVPVYFDTTGGPAVVQRVTAHFELTQTPPGRRRQPLAGPGAAVNILASRFVALCTTPCVAPVPLGWSELRFVPTASARAPADASPPDAMWLEREPAFRSADTAFVEVLAPAPHALRFAPGARRDPRPDAVVATTVIALGATAVFSALPLLYNPDPAFRIATGAVMGAGAAISLGGGIALGLLAPWVQPAGYTLEPVAPRE